MVCLIRRVVTNRLATGTNARFGLFFGHIDRQLDRMIIASVCMHLVDVNHLSIGEHDGHLGVIGYVRHCGEWPFGPGLTSMTLGTRPPSPAQFTIFPETSQRIS